MEEKFVSAECLSCESSFGIQYIAEMASQEYPDHCPFCGEIVSELTEVEEEEDWEEENWSEEDDWK